MLFVEARHEMLSLTRIVSFSELDAAANYYLPTGYAIVRCVNTMRQEMLAHECRDCNTFVRLFDGMGIEITMYGFGKT